MTRRLALAACSPPSRCRASPPPCRAERWLWNPRERTAIGDGAAGSQRGGAAARRPRRAWRRRTRWCSSTPAPASSAPTIPRARCPSLATGRRPEQRRTRRRRRNTTSAAHASARVTRRGAVRELEQALRFAPTAADAKHNLELALRQLDDETASGEKTARAPGGGRQGEQEQSQGQGQGDDRSRSHRSRTRRIRNPTSRARNSPRRADRLDRRVSSSPNRSRVSRISPT